ncbi:hypothetical protein DB346_13135 [Verrucomicrobia bacterium LW23]|nr:hypothetical protein DB346_13135 [Verrucomicrobia bacterium LW23]
MRIRQRRLKRGDLRRVLSTLSPCREPDSVADEQAPVRAAWRCITNRPNHFRYDEAPAHNLTTSPSAQAPSKADTNTSSTPDSKSRAPHGSSPTPTISPSPAHL